MSAQQNFNDLLDSLTGFEELAISERFGFDITTLLDRSATMAGRALVFTEKTRSGQKPGDAYKGAMSMTVRAVNDHFDTDEEPEVLEDETVTEQGKDG